MNQALNQYQPGEIASKIDEEIRALSLRNTPNVRAIRCKYSRMLKQSSPEFMLNLARSLFKDYGYRWVAYELLQGHRAAFEQIGEAELEEFGHGIDSWWTVDAFARTLSGPAWLHGQVPDELIQHWTHSDDLWWRRAALVSTVALNLRSHGGQGDVERTFKICRLLVDDHEDMVVKAMSWALRTLVVHDAEAVEGFLNGYDGVLAARVQREVRNKLITGLKNPSQKQNPPNR